MDKKIMIVAIIAVVAVVAGAAVVVFTGSHDSSSSDNGKIVGNTIAEKDFPNSSSRLWVYGNANEDDKLNNDDVSYLEAIINGSKTATRLADANADGKVDSKDVDYLKNILDATADTKIDVYYIDNYFKVAKVSWPVKSIATTYCSGVYTCEVTGLMSKVKMVDTTIANYWAKLNSNLKAATSLGSTEEPDYEKIMQNKIDVYIPGYCEATADVESPKKLNPAGIDVMFMNTCDNSGVNYPNEYIDRSIVMFGFLLQGDMTKTYQYLDWHDGILSKVKDAAATLAESDKGALIMSRNAPSYIDTGQYSITGKGNTNLIHADWAGVYSVGQHHSLLTKNYNSLTAENIYTVLYDTKTAGYSDLYWIDNEHDGLRGQRDLDATVESWKTLISAGEGAKLPTMHYLGMAREAGNSPMYVLEMVFYLNVMQPGLLSLNYETLFNEFIDTFATEKANYADVDIDNFFKDYDL